MNKNDFVNKIFFTHSFKETQELGSKFAKALKKGDAIYLYGDLGSGKTTFIQGLTKGLGIKNRIISPTFIIIRNYPLKNGRFYHIDLYRIKSKKDIEELGMEEIAADKNNIFAIEWAEKLKNKKSKKGIDVNFLYEKEGSRKITFRSSDQ